MIRQLLKHWATRWIVAPVAIVIGAAYSLYDYNNSTCTFRYKLTAEVETPDGLKTGSSVVEVSYSRSGDFGGGDMPNLNVVGDALYIDLGRKKNFFVTLTQQASGRFIPGSAETWFRYDGSDGATNVFSLPLRVLQVIIEAGPDQRNANVLCKLVREKANKKIVEVRLSWLPTLVSFDDLKDPNTSRVVQPDKFEEVFGPGFKLRTVIFQLTDESVVQKLDEVLPWLKAMGKKWSQGHTHGGDAEKLVDRLNYDAFRGPSTNPDGGATL